VKSAATPSPTKQAHGREQLFKEIERVEMMFENKESGFIDEINRLTEELKSNDAKYKKRLAQLRGEKDALESQLRSSVQTQETAESHLAKENEFLKTKLEKLTK
jgi:hypothetical protein